MHAVGVDAMTTVEAVDIKTSDSACKKQPKVGKNNKIKQQNKNKRSSSGKEKKNNPFEDDPVRDYF